MANNDFHYFLEPHVFDKLKPMNGQTIIKLKDDRDEHNGILLIGKANPLVPDRGVVVAVSEDREEKSIVVGSKVIFERYQGRKIFTERETFLLLHEKHISVILDDDADVGIKYDCKLT